MCTICVIIIVNLKSLCFFLDSWSSRSLFLHSLHPRNSCQNMLRPWRDMHGNHLTLTAKVSVPNFINTVYYVSYLIIFPLKKKSGNRVPVSDRHLKWCKPSSCHHFLETFLPENVFLLLQSVVVSFIIHILA